MSQDFGVSTIAGYGMKMELTEEQREFFRKAGAKGGKPRSVPHKEVGYCRCADCRKRGKKKDEGASAVDKEFDFGA